MFRWVLKAIYMNIPMASWYDILAIQVILFVDLSTWLEVKQIERSIGELAGFEFSRP